eukprot:7075473-Heterocapsa_arctica.AAC.1
MELAEKEFDEIELDNMLPRCLQRTRLLYGILVQTCSGRALALLRLIAKRNGLEAWRRLTAEYEP